MLKKKKKRRKQEEVYRLTFKGFLTTRFTEQTVQELLDALELFARRNYPDKIPAIVFDNGNWDFATVEREE